MSLHFSRGSGLIVIPARLHGPAGETMLRLALDTGATGTVLSWDALVLVGYDPGMATQRVEMATGSSVESVPRLVVERIAALGHERRGFPVVCHTLPPSVTVDGVLGLDFLRGWRLVVDFRTGLVTLD